MAEHKNRKNNDDNPNTKKRKILFRKYHSWQVVRFRIYMSRCFYRGIVVRALGYGIFTRIGGLLMF